MKDKKTPLFGVLVLGFKRPLELTASLNALSENCDLSSAEIFLSLDAASHIGETQAVNECKKILEQFSRDHPFASKHFASSHRGLKNNVVSSVSEAFNSVQRLLVIEDDCLIGKAGASYFNWGLSQLELRGGIGAISGTYFGRQTKPQAFLAKRFSSWGWATCRDTWQSFVDSKYLELPVGEMRDEIKRLTKNDPIPYRLEYRRISRNLRSLDSWAIPFDMFLRARELRTIKPTVNQIQNIGFGGNATHTNIGHSLSVAPQEIFNPSLELASVKVSKAIERAEAWRKFGKLAQDWVLRGA